MSNISPESNLIVNPNAAIEKKKSWFNGGTLALIIAFAGFCIIIYMTISSANERADLVKQLSEYKIREKQFKETRLKDSTTIITQSQTQITQQEALKLHLAVLEDGMKKLQAQITNSTVTHFDNIEVPYTPNGYIDTTGMRLIDTTGMGLVSKHSFKSSDSGTISVPMLFYLGKRTGDTTLEIGGYVGKRGLHIDSLNIPNFQRITIGEKLRSNSFFYRINPFKTLDPVITIHNSNPHIQTLDVGNVVIKPKKTAANKVWNTVKTVAAAYAAYSLIKK